MNHAGASAHHKLITSSDDEMHVNAPKSNVSRQSSGPYQCDRCHKSFAREDLLRRHQNREARALANPSVDRQKSCYACAKSKARCDLAYPQCGRCQARGINCVYAPHTGNPNARRARERGMSASQPPWSDEYNQDMRVAPYLVPRLSNHALEMEYKRRSSDSSVWTSSKTHPSLSTMDTSGEESDGNHTNDSIESSVANMDWLESSNDMGFPNTRMSQPHAPATVEPWSTVNTGMYPTSSAQSVAIMPPGSSMTNVPASQPMLMDMRAPIPSMTGPPLDLSSNASSSLLSKTTEKLALNTTMMVPPEPSEPTPERLPQLARLCTSNLNFPGSLQVPTTPSRNLASALSPGQSIAAAISHDWNTWLNEPIVPSPMYEHGPCTGWNGLVSATDASRTPTANDVQMRSSKEAQDREQTAGDYSSKSIDPSSPVLISAIDWWRRDTEAQWQFHRYTLTHSQDSAMLREDDPKSTLSFSVMSRFLAYCSFLCLREPSAPHPPFMHRNLLMMMKDRLPEPLAIASSVLAALAMRLPTSESWAWRLVGTELSEVVKTARGIMARVFECDQSSPDAKGLEQQLTNFDDAWELVGIVQSLWCYTVVSIYEEMRHSSSSKSEAGPPMDRGWCSLLIPETVGVLQGMVCILARAGLHLQNRAWESWSQLSPKSPVVQPFDFFWCLCETIRRTVLATHALLILLRHMRIGCDKKDSGAILGQPPYPARLYPLDWAPVMALKLPVVADIFDESNEAVWRVHLENALSRSSNENMALNLFLHNRPKGLQDRDSEINSLVYSYFHQHDEFTNVCLSTIFGLSTSL